MRPCRPPRSLLTAPPGSSALTRSTLPAARSPLPSLQQSPGRLACATHTGFHRVKHPDTLGLHRSSNLTESLTVSVMLTNSNVSLPVTWAVVGQTAQAVVTPAHEGRYVITAALDGVPAANSPQSFLAVQRFLNASDWVAGSTALQQGALSGA